MKFVAALALLALLLAGCSDGPASETGNPAGTTTSGAPGLGLNNTTAPPLPPPTYQLADCDQQHTFYPFPAQAVVPPLPPGFQPVTDQSGQLVDVFINSAVCSSGTVTTGGKNVSLERTGEMQIYVPVTPPSDLRDSSVTLDLVPIVQYTGSDEILVLLRNWTFDRLVGSAGFGQSGGAFGPGQRDIVTVDGGSESYDITTLVQVAAGPTFEAIYHVWLTDDAGGLIGRLRVTTTDGVNVGEGSAEFRSQSSGGPLNAGPPAWPGSSHVVSGSNVLVEHYATSDAEG